MQFSKRITPLFLSFTLIACCLTFQADAFSPTANTTTSWITTSIKQVSNQNTYHINHRKAHSILENNFSIFDFKCCLIHHKSLFATQYKKQDNLHFPLQLEFIKAIQQASYSKDDTFIG